MSDRISFSESNKVRAFKAGEIILSKGLLLGSTEGRNPQNRSWETNAFGIFMDDPTRKPEKIWFGLLGKTIPFKRFVGSIHFESQPQGANGKNWVISIYGRENIQTLTGVAEELSAKFEVKVHLRLETETLKYEERDEDCVGIF
jgi:hypothetical protein